MFISGFIIFGWVGSTEEALGFLTDEIADYLQGWKASLMNRAGRLIMVKAVLCCTYLPHDHKNFQNGLSRKLTKEDVDFYVKFGNEQIVVITWILFFCSSNRFEVITWILGHGYVR